MPKSRINKAMNANSTVLGLDIGGANLKAATAAGRAVSVAFPLWKQPDALPAALASLVAQFPGIDEFAVTMTGELCDCYATKREGVNRILDAVEFAANQSRERQRPVRVWSTSGNWLSVKEARVQTLAVAASNWHALATFAGRFAPAGNGLLIDIGTTTTDIIPLNDGVPVAKGLTDFDRLKTCELIYVGVKRTPIMALGLPNLCAEYFADIRDAFIVARAMPETGATDTADGRSEMRKDCRARLARMLGMDSESASVDVTREFALSCVKRLEEIIAIGIEKVTPTNFQTLILSGGPGEFVARAASHRLCVKSNAKIILLGDQLGATVSICAPAYAVAVLASEMPR